MLNMVKILIDDIEIEVQKDTTILQAADAAEVYIPRLCSHPDIPSVIPSELAGWDTVFWGTESKSNQPGGEYDGCQLCVVQVDGKSEPVRACITEVEEGMKVITFTDEIQKIRREKLKKTFATHPHTCIQCAQREGCALEPCSTDTAKEERCCPIFHVCELRRVSEFIGIPPETMRYHPANRPKIEDEPLFIRDYELCINCLRCVRMCRDVRKVDALGFVFENGDPVVGTKAPTLKDSGCVFCLSCVEVCPTGTLRLKFDDPRQDGEKVTKCLDGCPAGMDIPRYIREIRRGEFARAEAVIREAAPFPNVLGQVCFHPCEQACLRNEVSEPIAICSLKRAAVSHTDEPIWKENLKLPPPTGKKVAIIGAGPAGLTAAWFLKLKGHEVVVYDSDESPGGWLRNGIPPFRLSTDGLDADIKNIVDLGIEMKMGVEIGQEVSFDEIQNGHDAVFIATGARKGAELPCDGVELSGVESGLELLKGIERDSDVAQQIYSGETVVVIGGGNVAIDIARTALRLGPDKIHLYCLEERDEMPAHSWEIDEAELEGIVMHPGWGPKLIAGDGKVERIDFRKCLSVFDDDGRFTPTFDDSVTSTQDADRILIAIGQKSELEFISGSDIKLNQRGSIESDPDSLQTSIENVFAGGEVVSGPASVIDAIAQGRRAASGIDKYLGGDADVYVQLLDETELDGEFDKIENFAGLKRNPVPRLSMEESTNCLKLVETGYDASDAILEAERCLRCDLRLHIVPMPLPPEAWIEMNEEGVNSVPEIDGVYQLLDEEKVIYAIKGVSNLREALNEVLETTEKARFFIYDEDPMFSKRETELIQEYLKINGRMPPEEGEDDLDDLF